MSIARHLRRIGPAFALTLSLPLATACCSSGRAQAPDDHGGPGETQAADQTVRQRVEALLSGYEHVPTAEDWARVGKPEEVSAALIALATETRGKTLMAARATSSLGHFPRPEVAGFLERRLADGQAPASLRGKAAIALAAGFGDAKAEVIAALFASPDEALREDAVRAFARFASPAAERFLVERVAREPSAHLQAELGKAATSVATRRAELERAGKLDDAIKSRPAIKDPGPPR